VISGRLGTAIPPGPPAHSEERYSDVMRGSLAALLAAVTALGAALTASAATGPPVHSPTFPVTPTAFGMTVTASSAAAGAQDVQLTVTLRYAMQCSYPGAGPLVVTFPDAMSLPTAFANGSVRLSGRAVEAKVSDRKVTVTVPVHRGLMCDVMGPGRLVLTFTHAAKLANPASPGTYRFAAAHARRGFSTTLTISS